MTKLSRYMTMRDYARILFRHKYVILAAVLTIVGMAFVGLQLTTPIYEAQVKMLVSGVKKSKAVYYQDLVLMGNGEVGLTESEMVTSVPVLEQTVNALHMYEMPLHYEKNFASPLKKILINSFGPNGSHSCIIIGRYKP